jgi:hypothetical protein
MSAMLIYRALPFLRGCWLLLEWLFGWGPHARVNSFASLHPYAAVFADAVAVASWLVILGGLWFFRRSASFIARLGRTTTTGRRRPHLFSPSAYLLSCWMVRSLQSLFYRQCVIHLQGRPDQSIKLAPALFYGPSIFKEPGGSSLSALTAWSVFVSRRRQGK